MTNTKFAKIESMSRSFEIVKTAYKRMLDGEITKEEYGETAKRELTGYSIPFLDAGLPVPEGGGSDRSRSPLTITKNGVTNTPSGVYYDPITVDVAGGEPNLQEKTVTENGEVTPDSGYDGLSKVTVNVPSSGGDSFVIDRLVVPKATVEGITYPAIDLTDLRVDLVEEKNGTKTYIFDRCVFKVKMSNNLNLEDFTQSELYRYMKETFEPALRAKLGKEVEVFVPTKDYLFGDDRPEFFRTPKNRISYDSDEYSCLWWLSTCRSPGIFYGVSDDGYLYDDRVSGTSGVRFAYNLSI